MPDSEGVLFGKDIYVMVRQDPSLLSLTCFSVPSIASQVEVSVQMSVVRCRSCRPVSHTFFAHIVCKMHSFAITACRVEQTS